MINGAKNGFPERWGRYTWEGLKYSLYIISHPFDGFWRSQREKKGNAAAATVINALFILALIFSRQATGYIFNYNDPANLNVLNEIAGVAAPLMLWCTVNWSVTTLMDGKGTFRDIYIATSYALTPMVIFIFIQTIASNLITYEESGLYNLLSGIAYIWSGFLLFTGMMTIQQYSVKKTVFTFIIDIIGMLAVFFLFLLFFALIQQVVDFVYVLYTESMLRLR